MNSLFERELNKLKHSKYTYLLIYQMKIKALLIANDFCTFI